PIFSDLLSGQLQGEIQVSEKRVCDLEGYWLHPDLARGNQEKLYTTQTWWCEPDGTEGAVLWGNTALYPGQVGDEYFMTRGHWHEKRDRGELVVTVSGHGYQVLMGEDRVTRVEEMSPGSTHWVPGHHAHRTVNVGEEPLVFFCAWPADCGHDYASLQEQGFSSRVLRFGGRPLLVAM
ncbi:MAG TPA: glucose-6-phosphate isomerase family protein, partial [Fimbriimonas sp.]